MSMDAGGLAQMTYNNFSPVGGVLGAPASGFASRGKATQLKRLNLASQPTVGPIHENPGNMASARTSRSHLLAGLRTAPRSSAAPVSAPYAQSRFGFDDGGQHVPAGYGAGSDYPQSAMSSSFATPAPYGRQAPTSGQQHFATPEQVLAPPPVQYVGPDEQMDPNMVAQLMATEVFLAQRQQQLQQQLAQLTVQQLANIQLDNINQQQQQQQQQQQPPFLSNVANAQATYFGQSMPTGIPQSREVHQTRPGLANMYNNSLSGQYHSNSEPVITQQQLPQFNLSTSPPPLSPRFSSSTSPPKGSGPSFRYQTSPPREPSPSRSSSSKASSLHRKTPSPPQEVAPLPPPSANAFRRGHKKASSLAFKTLASNDSIEGPKSSALRTSDFPRTPMTGGFGPGQARIGEHPSRQPRGPPPMEDLTSKPTSKHAGSKNFAARARRTAWDKIRRAGIERSTGRPGSSGSSTPANDGEPALPSSLEGDADTLTAGSTALPSIQTHGALPQIPRSVIGSERKEFQERLKVRRVQTISGMAADDSCASLSMGMTAAMDDQVSLDRKTPLLVLTTAEKRRSAFL